MVKYLFALALIIIPVIAHGATCAAGYYLYNGACVECISGGYCPGDDLQHSCTDLWSDDTSGVKLTLGGTSSVPGATSPNDCTCVFLVSTPNDPTTTQQYHTGKCNTGPTDYLGASEALCRPGYYPFGQPIIDNIYEHCTPCTNAPTNTTYTSNGTPNANDCSWKCTDGWMINSDSSGCDKLCALGYTKINTSTGVSIPLYAEKRTTPSINIGGSQTACYADLAPGRATGAINVTYNNDIYHTVSPTTTLQCDAGYYLSDYGTCIGCDWHYYCPGDNTRVQCTTTIIAEPSIASPNIYYESNLTLFSKPTDCMCRWDNLSNERMAQYYVIRPCYLGATNAQYSNTYVYYQNCQVGYYAIHPRNNWNRYSDCAPCDNRPLNSHYTSYSTPSIMYAVESNCPWECNDGYIRDGDTCIANP